MIKYVVWVVTIVLMGAQLLSAMQHVYAMPTSVTQGGAYSRGYNDASCDAALCNGHGYDPMCPGDHSSEYCSNYKDGYAAGWHTSTNANNNSQSGWSVNTNLPFWMPAAFPSETPLKNFQVILHNVRPEFNLIRVCVTDINSTHGVCHYMNTTEEEDQAPPGTTMDAGVFSFPYPAFPVNDTLQLCIKSIPLSEEHCIWDKNDTPQDEVTRYTSDMSVFGHEPKIIEKSEIFNYMPLVGSGIV